VDRPVVLVLLASGAAAQFPGLTAPEVSRRATASQVVGLTELAVSYDRPAANGPVV
jgi:hypothetical protein